MKFYDCQTAPSPRRVRMFIAEKHLNIETVQVDLRNGEQLSEAFLAVNPRATVPVIETDSGARFLSTAGCRAYLEASHPEPALLGRDATERAEVADLIAAIEADAFMAVAECLRNSAKGMRGRALTGPQSYAQIPELAERGRTRAGRFLPELNAALEGREFLVGETLTAADIDAFVFVEFSQWIKLDVPATLTNLARWRTAVAARPSAGL
ncbi:MAG: glutathione S-transferase [Pseudomonadota bacterium]